MNPISICRLVLALSFIAVACNKHDDAGTSPAPSATTPPTTTSVPTTTTLTPRPVTCAAAAEKFNALSIEEAKQAGTEWTAEKGAKKMDRFVKECEEAKVKGEFGDAELACVLRADELGVAKKCLKKSR